MKSVFSILLCLLFFLAACNSDTSISKNSYLKKFRSFVAEVEQNYASYNEEDWDKSDEAFNIFSKIDYESHKDKLTESEKEEVNNLIGKYNGLKLKGKSRIFINEMDETIEETTERVKGFIEAVTEGDTLEHSSAIE